MKFHPRIHAASTMFFEEVSEADSELGFVPLLLEDRFKLGLHLTPTQYEELGYKILPRHATDIDEKEAIDSGRYPNGVLKHSDRPHPPRCTSTVICVTRGKEMAIGFGPVSDELRDHITFASNASAST